jgi:hypothetical protein
MLKWLINLFKPMPYHLGTSSEPRPFPVQTKVGDYNSHVAFLEMHGIVDEGYEQERKEIFDNNLKRLGLYGKETLTFEEFKKLFKEWKE